MWGDYMKRTAIALMVLAVVWVAFAFAALMALYGAAPDPARDIAFESAGKWYTVGYADK